ACPARGIRAQGLAGPTRARPSERRRSIAARAAVPRRVADLSQRPVFPQGGVPAATSAPGQVGGRLAGTRVPLAGPWGLPRPRAPRRGGASPAPPAGPRVGPSPLAGAPGGAPRRGAPRPGARPPPSPPPRRPGGSRRGGGGGGLPRFLEAAPAGPGGRPPA